MHIECLEHIKYDVNAKAWSLESKSGPGKLRGFAGTCQCVVG